MPRTFMDNEATWFPEGALDDLPDIESDRSAYEIIGWALEPGDAVFFNMLTLHCAGGVEGPQRRRVLSLRFLGDDVTHAPRSWKTSPEFPGLADELAPGRSDGSSAVPGRLGARRVGHGASLAFAPPAAGGSDRLRRDGSGRDDSHDPRHDRGEASLAGGAERGGDAADGRGSGGATARARQAACARAGRAAARSGVVRRARPVRAPPRGGVRDAGEAAIRRRRRDRLRHGLRPSHLRLLAGFHRLRRLAQRGVRGEDLQGDGHGGEGRLPGRRDQRLGRRADPGGCRLARRLRGDLLAQRAGVRRRPAGLADSRAVRRRCCLLARDHGFRADGRGVVVHVHHRPRCREDGHR